MTIPTAHSLKDPSESQIGPVLIADGYGISLSVQRGDLTIHDGTGSKRRTRTYSRIERNLRRILILGHTGTISLDALRWCAERNIAVAQLDADNQIITLAAAPGLDDARLRRAQALASGNANGLAIARLLIGAKVRGQAGVAESHLSGAVLATSIRRLADRVDAARTIEECRDAESHAANAYYGGWAGTVEIQFIENDAKTVPEHWHSFASRRSPIMRGRTPRVATTPINALLNYLYATAEVEARIALITIGLDPGLGIVHVDAKARDSLALDLLEVVRPDVDRYTLDLLQRRRFRARDFNETRQGNCRLMPDLAHELAPTSITWAMGLAPYAEQLAHLLTADNDRVGRATPLTRTKSRDSQVAGGTGARRSRATPKPVALVASTCRVCGVKLADRQRQLCSACWPRSRAQLATDRAKRGAAEIAARRARGVDPTNTPEARASRAEALSRGRRAQRAWESQSHAPDGLELSHIQAGLRGVPLGRIVTATGLSLSAASRIRSGQLVPHRRHWPVLASLGSTVGLGESLA